MCPVLNIDTETSKYYGEILATLYEKGKPIPTNDVWIAATALQYGLTIMTKDKHFNEISIVNIQQW